MELVGEAGLSASLKSESKLKLRFSANWDVVKDWTPDSRYKNWNQKEAEDIVRAISEKTHGVLPWLKRHW